MGVAGPGGLLIGFACTAVIALCVMACIGEMVLLFPTSNAMVDFVHHFVDEDLVDVQLTLMQKIHMFK